MVGPCLEVPHDGSRSERQEKGVPGPRARGDDNPGSFKQNEKLANKWPSQREEKGSSPMRWEAGT